MFGSSFLTLAIQILGFFMIAVGIYTTLYPLNQKKHKVVCLIIFVAMGIAVIVLSTVQSNQASKEQTDLRNQIERIRADNHQDIQGVQARLDAVVAAVRNSPPNADIKKLSERVGKLSVAAPSNLTATVQ
jgi:type VI protein secretion system component VasK